MSPAITEAPTEVLLELVRSRPAIYEAADQELRRRMMRWSKDWQEKERARGHHP